MSMPLVQIREVTCLDDPAVVPMLELYVETFDAWAREPIRDIARQLRTFDGQATPPPTRHFVAERDSQVIGLVRGSYMPNAHAGIIVHLGLARVSQGQGIGPVLIQAAHEAFRLDAERLKRPFQGTLLEVERVEDAANEEERHECERRIRFFKRVGVELVTPTYTQDSMGPGLPPVPLNLFVLPNGPLDRERLIVGLYADLFRIDSSHEFVQRALAGMPT